MNDADLATLATHIRANTDPAVIAALAVRSDSELARLYNLPAVPSYPVWKRRLTSAEMHKAYVWTEMDSFTNVAKQFQFNLLLSQGEVDPSDANVRAGFNEIFTGPGLAATRNALIALAKRDATVFETVFAGPQSGGAATMVLEGPVAVNDVSDALNKF